MAATLEDLHRLVDQLPDDVWARESARLALLYARTGNPVYRSLLLAPVDDEPETDEERAAVAEARAEIAQGEPGVTLDALEHELGLSCGAP